MRINATTQPAFQASIAPSFENELRTFINHRPCSVKHNYILSQQKKKFEEIGYSNYTLHLVKKAYACGMKFYLYGTKNGKPPERGFCLMKAGSFPAIVTKILTMSPEELKRITNR